MAVALVIPLCKRAGQSPILGFLATGTLLGPNGLRLIADVKATEVLGELGIVFFLFEMGLELSIQRLAAMKKDVFGLGLAQFFLTALGVAAVASRAGLGAPALVVIGGGIALSSSAFVLQLLKDRDDMGTRYGRASFGILLLQDLAVVPLLVAIPLLAGTGGSMAKALTSAAAKACIALGTIAFLGQNVLDRLFFLVARAKSQEAFLAVILLTVMSMSSLTEGLGLSNTLGAFLAGVLLSETKYRYQVEADIAPFRGMLLGLFFMTVGFEIDLGLVASNLPMVGSLVVGLLALKAAITTLVCLTMGLSLANAQQTGLLLSQGGEFAFVAFGMAERLGILSPGLTKLLLTTVAISMAATPALSSMSARLAARIEGKMGFSHYVGIDSESAEIKEREGFVVVCGYGRIGRLVCDLLDKKFIPYVAFEADPQKAMEARQRGLPVFYGDVTRPEVLRSFNVGKAQALISTISDIRTANKAVVNIRREFPDLPVFARAKDAQHQKRLQGTLNVTAMVPVLPEDSIMVSLPFGGAFLRSLGLSQEEVNVLVEDTRKKYLISRGLEEEETENIMSQLSLQISSRATVGDDDGGASAKGSSGGGGSSSSGGGAKGSGGSGGEGGGGGVPVSSPAAA
ncbi:Sodium/hydrogen exchanger family-domain-containing protein [Tribonema minus]|uniref:Sodium/hydrogen exchanger family-domain-containing protein n=1 Tax=Tribonema minus TaxID=303371 RepID=A0A835Z5B4_9STRA|nr:Sodium/hydrogen exchanger family-domain-containing protein [Tribonema minus]